MKKKLIKKWAKKAGLPPGTLVHTGEKKTDEVRIRLIDYDESQFQEKELSTVEECFSFKDTPTVTWINIDGIHDVKAIEKIGKHFNVHPLVLEDIVNTEQRTKIEDFDSLLFIVLKMFTYITPGEEINIEQVSLLVGSNFVISFQEVAGDAFNAVRERIRGNKGRIRKMGADYLCYALIDAIVDNYFFVIEKIGEWIEDFEEEVVSHPTPDTLQKINALRRETIILRKSIWPLREVVNSLARDESKLIENTTLIYFRDVYDHTIRVIESLETFREIILGLLDSYLSNISNKTNEVMKVLTIIATLFIPLTFIAGVYGMNFKYMPELDWKWAYPLVWIVMLIIGCAMVAYFRRKRWI